MFSVSPGGPISGTVQTGGLLVFSALGWQPIYQQSPNLSYILWLIFYINISEEKNYMWSDLYFYGFPGSWWFVPQHWILQNQDDNGWFWSDMIKVVVNFNISFEVFPYFILNYNWLITIITFPVCNIIWRPIYIVNNCCGISYINLIIGLATLPNKDGHGCLDIHQQILDIYYQ